MDVALPTSPCKRAESREGQNPKATPYSPRQKEICPPLPQPPTLPVPRLPPQEGAQCTGLRPAGLDEVIYRPEHLAQKAGHLDLREELLQADEQLRLRQDNGEPPKANRCQARAGRRGGKTPEAPIQPVLCKSSSIWRKPCGNPDAQREHPDEQTGLHGHVRPRSLQNPDVQVLLPAPQVQVRRALRGTLHRHRLAPPRDQDGGYLRRHGAPPRALRHERLSQGPSPPQPGEQEGHRQDEGRVQRKTNLRGRLPALQDVLHFDLGQRKQKESEGHHQSRNRERDQPPELQGRPIRQAILQARDGHVPKYRPPDLHSASQ